jgi:hypothetical protein
MPRIRGIGCRSMIWGKSEDKGWQLSQLTRVLRNFFNKTQEVTQSLLLCGDITSCHFRDSNWVACLRWNESLRKHSWGENNPWFHLPCSYDSDFMPVLKNVKWSVCAFVRRVFGIGKWYTKCKEEIFRGEREQRVTDWNSDCIRFVGCCFLW